MAIVASAHVLLAGALLQAAPLEAPLTTPSPVSGMEEVAETRVVPLVPELMTSLHLDVAPPPVYLHSFPTRRSSDLLVIVAVAVPLPSVVFTAVTVMVSV